MSDMELYSRYFPVGKKVGVGIPMPNADVFRDWAIIHSIDEDLVSLQLSRDVLPVDVSLHYGQILELRGGSDNNGYCCRAIVVSEGDAQELLLRLIGEIVSDELREFYRIDAFLPIKYFVSREQNIERLHKQWEERRVRRQQSVIDHEEPRWTSTLPSAGAEFPHEQLHDPLIAASDAPDSGQIPSETEEQLSWDSIIPLAANISGSGLRIITHEGFEYGEYMLLEILVPSPHRVVDVVGRVVFANRNYAAGSDHDYFNTGVQFVYIDERDQDAIVTYISSIQLKRIRQLRERYLLSAGPDYAGRLVSVERIGIRKFFTPVTVAALLFGALFALLFSYFWNYAHEHPKGEIQRTFEEGVRKYREELHPK